MSSSPDQAVPTSATCEQEGCCSTTEEGSWQCSVTPVAGCGCQTDCDCTTAENTASQQSVNLAPQETRWQAARSTVMFVVGCLASPCCTPLFVPILLGLLGSAPLAVWLGQHLGWVYGGLTVLSFISFGLALRWSGKPRPARSGNAPVFTRVHTIRS